MADGEIITSDQIIDPNAFPGMVNQVDIFIESLNRAVIAITKVMTASKGGLGVQANTIENIQQIQQLTQKTNEHATVITKTKGVIKELTIAQAEANIMQREANAGVVEAAKNNLGLTSEYQKQSTILNELRNRYRDLALTNQTNTAEAKKLHQEITTLDGKLKSVDATVGVHNRNVGNYTKSILTASRGIGGMAGLLDILGRTLGVNEDILKSLTETHHAFTAGARDVHHALETTTTSTEANTVATEAGTVAQEESNAAWLASPIGIIAAVALAIGAVGVAVYAFVKSEEDSYAAMTKTTQAFADQQKAINNLDETIRNEQRKHDVLIGAKTQQESDLEEITYQSNLKQIKLEKELNQKLDAIRKEYGIDKKNDPLIQIQKGKLKEADITNKIYIELYAKEKELLKQAEEEKAKIKVAANLENNNLIEKEMENDDVISGKKLKKAEDFEDTLRHLQNDNIRYSYEEKKAKINENFADESKKYEGHTEILLQLELKREKELQELWEDQQRAFDKIKTDFSDEAIKKVKDDAKKMADENKDPEFDPQLKANFDLAKKQKDLKDKERKEEIKQEEELADQIVKIVSDAENKKSELKLKAIERQAEINQTAIDQQIALGVNGNAQVLAAELKKQDELEKAHQKEIEAQKKRAQQEEAIQLGLAFIKAFNADLDKGKTGAQALVDASEEVLAAKLIGKALAGSAYEGVEDTGNGGNLDSKGGNLWMLHPNERVIPKKLNDKLDGISNDELIDNALAFKNIYQPNFNDTILQDYSRKQQVDHSIMHEVVSELKSVKQAIEDKPVEQTNIDHLGRLTKRLITKNNIRITTKQTYLND